MTPSGSSAPLLSDIDESQQQLRRRLVPADPSKPFDVDAPLPRELQPLLDLFRSL